MRGTMNWMPRRVPGSVLGLVLASVALVGCGEDSSNPEAVTVDDLQYPGALSVADNGAGTVVLSWTGSNNEEDFDGYNVYGMADDDDGTLSAKEGESVILLDQEGGAVEDARNYLAKYNYDPAKGLTAPAEAVDDDGEALFSALPIHTLDGEEKLLPTCKVDKGGVCQNTTAAELGDADRNNGGTSYTIDGLTIGQRYCFLVLASIDQGSKVSMTSSNVACIVPKYSASVSFAIPAAAANNLKFDLNAYLTACAASTDGTCAAPGAALSTDAGVHGADDEGPIYIESDKAFIAGKNSAVVDLGVYPDGFSAADLPEVAPPLSLDPNKFINGGGYSVAGQSVPILANHAYVFAVGDATADGPSSFHYHWLWVKSTTISGTIETEMRLSKGQNER